MKRSFLVIFLLLIYFSPYILPLMFTLYDEGYFQNPFDYARITDVDYKAVLVDEPDSNAKIIVTEKLTFDIHAASKDNLFWELWRDLPEDNIDGLNVKYKVNSVKQILDDGSEVVYGQSPKLYWDDYDYVSSNTTLGPNKWYHSEGPYSEYYKQYECLLFYVDGLYREKVTFEIEYEMSNAAFKYNDCSELYLCMYSGETIKHLNSFNGEILISEDDMPLFNNYEAHTYGTSYSNFDFNESKSSNPGYHTFSFNLEKEDLKFNPNTQYLEFCLISHGEDKHKFTEYAPANNYTSHDVLQELRDEHLEYESTFNKYAFYKLIILLVCVCVACLILNKLLKAHHKIREKYNFYEPTMQMEYFRDIPSNISPTLAATLVFCKDNKPQKDADGYSALMLSLVQKGYIELEKIIPERDWTSSNVKIVIKKTPMVFVDNTLESNLEDRNDKNILSKEELHYFNLISRHCIGSEISMRLFQSKVSSDYENTNTFIKNIEHSTLNSGLIQNYFQRADYNKPKNELISISKFYLFTGIVFLLFVNLISYQSYFNLAFGGYTILGITLIFASIIYRKLSQKAILLTQFGEDEYVKWRGLYNFLNSETLINERTIVELPIWEQYLIYATAFGISAKVIKALKIRCPDMDLYTSPLLSNSYYRSTSFRYASHSFRTATQTASYRYSSSRFNSYGGFGGGYGGGGRGGGGGRRWSLK